MPNAVKMDPSRKEPVLRRQCGTDTGYRTHIRHKEYACDDCLEAHRLATRSAGRVRRAKQTGAPVDNELRSKAGVTKRQSKVLTKRPRQQRATPGYPQGLQKGGKKLWDDLHDSYSLDSVSEVLALELCRSKDKLDRIAAALNSKHCLWFELDDGKELDTGELEVKIVVNPMIGESRQLATAMAQMMNKLGVLKKAEESQQGDDPLAVLVERRKKRSA